MTSSPHVLLTLGTFQFAVSTAAYESLRRSAEYRWPAQERIVSLPARQFIGPGAETIELEGVIYPQEQGSAGQMATLRELAARGQALTLTSGTGEVLGSWCVERVTETGTAFFSDGTPRKVEFQVSISRYGEE